MKIFEAYQRLGSFISLSGSLSQEETDFDKAVNELHKVSLKLLARKKAVRSSDIIREADEKYTKLGELIQTKILFYLQNKDEVSLIQNKVLNLADTFADANFNKLDSCISSLEAIPKTGDFEPPKSLFETHPILGSVLTHLGKFTGSAIIVTLIAFVYATVFQYPFFELTPYILTSTVVLFVGWEFKSK